MTMIPSNSALTGYDTEHDLAVQALAPGLADRRRVMDLARAWLPPRGDPRTIACALDLNARIVLDLQAARPGAPMPAILLAASGLTLLALAELAAEPGRQLQ